MPQSNRPRKGSLGFGPRKRASSETPRFNSWPDSDGQPTLQGFAGYKAGMTHVVMINDRSDSPREGMEETVPVTIVETPPMKAVALRAYEDTSYGLKPITEVWADDLDSDLDRVLDVPEVGMDDADLQDALENGRIDEVRMITHTQPSDLRSVPKDKPDVMETRLGTSSPHEGVEYGLDLLEDGGDHVMTDVFREGEYLDTAGVTKGKGLQGPVKRWGVQKRKGKHKRQGWRRRIGNLGPWNPSRVRSTVPQQGQTGYHQRTELNKRLVSIGDPEEDEDPTPDGGFVNYGEVDGPFALVKGSVPGPEQRLVRFRPAIRPTDKPRLDPEVRFVSTQSNQGT
jgi:large subunit ribosomal protein L3